MMKQFQIAIDSMCVAAILSAGAPVLAEEVPDTSGVQLAMEYLLSQDASDNVKVSFQMDGTAESTEELTAIGEKLADRILQVLLKEGKESYQSSQYPYTESGFWLNYWYDESLGSCIGCVLDPTDNGLTVDIFLHNYESLSIDWSDIPFGLSFGDDRKQIEAAIQNAPYYCDEKDLGTFTDIMYLVLTPGADQVEYIQLNATSYLIMQNMKIQAENDVIIPTSNYLYNAIYYMEDAEFAESQKTEVAKILAKKWDGNWTNGYEKGNWQYYLSTADYLGDDPLIETDFWKQWGRVFSSYCSVSVGETMTSGHSTVTHSGKGIMPIELLQSWKVK